MEWSWDWLLGIPLGYTPDHIFRVILIIPLGSLWFPWGPRVYRATGTWSQPCGRILIPKSQKKIFSYQTANFLVTIQDFKTQSIFYWPNTPIHINHVKSADTSTLLCGNRLEIIFAWQEKKLWRERKMKRNCLKDTELNEKLFLFPIVNYHYDQKKKMENKYKTLILLFRFYDMSSFFIVKHEE